MKTRQARQQGPRSRARLERGPCETAPAVLGNDLPALPAETIESARQPTPETRDPSAENARLATEALHRYANAERLENTPSPDLWSGILARHEARRQRERIPELLQPGPLVSAAGEAIPALGFGEINGRRDTLVDTLERPTRISVCASEQRMELLEKAGIVHAGTDLVATIGAKNSIEKMLAHQMAAAHKVAMTLVAQISSAATESTTPEVAAIVARTGKHRSSPHGCLRQHRADDPAPQNGRHPAGSRSASAGCRCPPGAATERFCGTNLDPGAEARGQDSEKW